MPCTQPQPTSFEPPAYALRVLEALEAAGHEAWIVGGWVRDCLRGMPGHDIDVCTSALWQQTEEVLLAAGVEVHQTGTQHGTVTAVVEGKPVEVTTYRVEGTYSDLRHPDEVRFVRDVREDLGRRDFTINAMAWHPTRGLLDPYGGRDDLAAGIIRCVGDPHARLSEDALRVLRAVRFASRMGFDVEPATEAALVDCADGLAAVASERIGIELCGIVGEGYAGRALMAWPEVMCAAVPELAAMRGFDQRSPYHEFDVWEHTARVCWGAEAFCGGVASEELRWAALFHDMAKPQCASVDANGRGHFFGHPEQSAQLAAKAMRRLALPTDLVRRTCCLVRLHDYELRGAVRSARAVRRLVARIEATVPGEGWRLAHELVCLMRADALAKARRFTGWAVELDRVEAVMRRERQASLALSVRELAVGGRDVIETCGIEPGPQVGVILDWLLERVLEGELANRREVLLDALGSYCR